MNDNSNNLTRLIFAIEVLLAQLDASLSAQMTEGDSRTDSLKNQIDGFKSQTSRLKSVLRKHQATERRKRMLDKQNRQNTRRPKNG